MVVRPSYSSSGSDATHRFLTQRQAPSLATIDASIPVEFASEIDNRANDDSNKDVQTKSPKSRKKTIIRLSHGEGPNRSHVHVGITPSTLKSLPISYRAGLWDDVVTVVDVGDEAASFVTNVIKSDAPHFGDARVVYVMGGRTIDEKVLSRCGACGFTGCVA